MNPERTLSALRCEFSLFQFKLFANNVTKFRAHSWHVQFKFMVTLGSFFLYPASGFKVLG
jgi:hypothetical protein